MNARFRLFRSQSLGWRVVIGVVLGEVLFSLVLGVTIGAYSVRAAAQQRQDALSQMSGVIAAALMPEVADQQLPQVRAQMQSIIEAADVSDVESIRIVDSSGTEIASETLAGGRPAAKAGGIFTLLTSSQLIEQPVVVDGLQIATVYVQLAPVGVVEALRPPLLAAAIVVLAVVLVSVPWTAWLLVRGVVEPLEELSDWSTNVAEGQLDTAIESTRRDEIGRLQRSLVSMATQIRERDEAVRQSYVELSQAHAQLRHMDQLKSDFVAVASHELRTPLSTIRLYSEMLESGEVCELDEAGLNAVASIGSAASRLGSIVSDLMDSALLERGMMQLEHSDVWLEELVTLTVADADVLARARGVRVVVSNEVPELVLRGDPLRLRQVLDNVISNAVKYSDGADLVTVEVVEEPDSVAIRVIDRGRGISQADDQEVLFTLFGRLDAQDNRDTAGLGLGLAIGARIVEAHGGTITFEPNGEGKGSIFTVRLPINQADEIEPVCSEVRVVGGDVHDE